MSVFQQIGFKIFLDKVTFTRDYDSIITYVKKHKNLSIQQQSSLTDLMCQFNQACYLVEFAKNGINDNACLQKIGEKLSKSDCHRSIEKFIIMFPRLSVTDQLINRLCELRRYEQLYGILFNDNINSNSRRNIVESMIQHGTMTNIEVLVKCFGLTFDDRKKITTRVCKSLDGSYICMFSSLFIEDDKEPFVEAIIKTGNAEMMYNFMVQNNNLQHHQIEKIISAISNTNNLEYIYKSLLLLENDSNSLRIMLLEKINKSDNPKYMMLTTVYFDKKHLINNFEYIQNLYEKAINENIFTDEELTNMNEYMQEVKKETPQLVYKKNSK